jgi:hypothetical protein
MAKRRRKPQTKIRHDHPLAGKDLAIYLDGYHELPVIRVEHGPRTGIRRVWLGHYVYRGRTLKGQHKWSVSCERPIKITAAELADARVRYGGKLITVDEYIEKRRKGEALRARTQANAQARQAKQLEVTA